MGTYAITGWGNLIVTVVYKYALSKRLLTGYLKNINEQCNYYGLLFMIVGTLLCHGVFPEILMVEIMR